MKVFAVASIEIALILRSLVGSRVHTFQGEPGKKGKCFGLKIAEKPKRKIHNFPLNFKKQFSYSRNFFFVF